MAQFQKGTSGNPKGRPRGIVDQRKLRTVIAKDVPSIIQALTEQAKAGDVQACRLLLDRCLPALRPVDAPTPIQLVDGLTENGRAVLAALGTGELGANQAAQLLSAIGTLAKIHEVDELTRRVEQLEQARDE